MSKNHIDINSIDISQATPEQIASAQEVVEDPWAKTLFDGKWTFEKALRHEMYRELTVKRTVTTEGNITALFGLPFQKK